MKIRRRSPTAQIRHAARQAGPLHRRIALHPASVLLLLCVGVLLGGITFKDYADSYQVSATVAAAPLTEPAVITSPADQTHFTAIPITVIGTCPQNSYVKLFRNNVFSGTAICSSGQTTFQIQTDLSPGSNSLLAQDYNLTNQAGPAGTAITVYYDVPVAPSAPASSSPPGSPSAAGQGSTSLQSLQSPATPPFLISTDFRYQPITSGQPFTLNLTLSGGTAPYAVTVDWGDGTQSTLLRATDGTFSAKHTYSVTGYLQQIYKVKIQAADRNGQAAFLEIAELVHGPNWYPGAPLTSDSTGAGTGTGAPSNLQQWLRLIWPAYGVVVLMVFSFWLGERQEYGNLHHLRPHHR